MAFPLITILPPNWMGIILFFIICCYLVVFLLIGYGWQKIPEIDESDINKAVTVSVVIAARNEDETLPRLLNDLYRQSYPVHLFEIIIIDDHSDKPVNDLKEVTGYPGHNLRVLDMPAGTYGKKQALLEGVKNSHSELLLFTDADCRTGPEWIQSFAEHYLQYSPDLIIGLIDYCHKPGIHQSFFRSDLLSLVITGAGTASLGFATLCNGANLAIKRNSYLRFAENIKSHIPTGDDMFMMHAIKKQNNAISVLKNRNSIVRTEPPENGKEFLHQRIRWASKGTRYDDRETVWMAILVFISNLVIFISPFLCFVEIVSWRLFTGIFILKVLSDCQILSAAFGYFGRKHTIFLVPLFMPAYVIYAIATPFLGLLFQYSWKGRSYKGQILL